MKENVLLRPMNHDDLRLVKMLKALGNPVRFQIVQILAEKQVCITGEIVEWTTLAQSTVSQHLKVLKDSGIVIGETEGPATCYCLNQMVIEWLKEKIGLWLSPCCTHSQTNSDDHQSEHCC